MSLAPFHMLMPIRIQLSEEITHRLEAKTCLIKDYFPKIYFNNFIFNYNLMTSFPLSLSSLKNLHMPFLTLFQIEVDSDSNHLINEHMQMRILNYQSSLAYQLFFSQIMPVMVPLKSHPQPNGLRNLSWVFSQQVHDLHLYSGQGFIWSGQRILCRLFRARRCVVLLFVEDYLHPMGCLLL